MIYDELWDEEEFKIESDQLQEDIDPVIEEPRGYQNSNEEGWFYDN